MVFFYFYVFCNHFYDEFFEFDHECFYKDKYGYCHNKIDLRLNENFCEDHKDSENHYRCEECGTIDEKKSWFSNKDACPCPYGSCTSKLVCKKHIFICIKCNKKRLFTPGDFYKVSKNHRFLCEDCYTDDYPSLRIRVWWGLSVNEYIEKYD